MELGLKIVTDSQFAILNFNAQVLLAKISNRWGFPKGTVQVSGSPYKLHFSRESLICLLLGLGKARVPYEEVKWFSYDEAQEIILDPSCHRALHCLRKAGLFKPESFPTSIE